MPTTYGNDIVYCLKSHCGVRGYCRQKWVLQVQIICKFSNERTCKRNKDVQGLSCGFEVQLVIEYKVASEFRSFSRTFIEENNIIDLLYNSIMSSFNEKKNINRKVTLTRNHGTRFVLTITINRVDYDDCESDGMITLHDTYKNEDLIISGFNVNGYNDADIKVRFEKTYSKLGNQLNLAFTKRTASGSKFENNYLSATREEIEEYERLLNPK